MYIETDKRMIQSWRHADWPANHSSTVRLVFDQQDDAITRVLLEQSDVPAAQIKRIDGLWNQQIWRPLGGVLVRSLLQQVFFENLSPHDVYELLTDSNKCSRMTNKKYVSRFVRVC